MGSPRKNKSAPAEVMTLEIVKAATRSEPGFVYTAPEFHQSFVEQGLVEINADMTDGDGKIATRATFKDEEQMTEQTQVETKVKPTFAILDAAPEPEKKVRASGNRAGREPIYPFDKLNEGQGFFVPGKEAKAMASTVASANARYSEVIEGETRTQTRGKNKGAVVPATRQLRKFTAYDTTVDGTKGVYIKRVAV